jgi:anti-sigma factor RsiW
MSSPRDPDTEPLIARDADYHRAPDGLRDKVHAALAATARESRGPALARWLALGAAFAAVGLLSWNVALFTARGSDEERVADEVVTAHVRSLMSEAHLDDVLSSDQHTVKPWFSGKLDFAPPVHDLANAGYALTGGRLDYLQGRAVAAMTYRYRKHIVNLFVWPAANAADAAPIALTRQGYALLAWRQAGMQYWAIADTAPAQLAPLAEALRSTQ